MLIRVIGIAHSLRVWDNSSTMAVGSVGGLKNRFTISSTLEQKRGHGRARWCIKRWCSKIKNLDMQANPMEPVVRIALEKFKHDFQDKST